MEVINTPDHCFLNLPDYPYKAHYINLTAEIRMHYLDEGPENGDVVLLLHGEPSWSFLYRKMIPVFVSHGFRVLVPDLIGFGKSSKPVDMVSYSYQSHLSWCQTWLDSLNLSSINLFVQDWGGLLGLRLVAAHPDRFDRIVVANTGLPTGAFQMPDAFLHWQKFSQSVDELPIGKILQNSTVNLLSDSIIAAYEAPFPDASFQAGAKIFPSLVPTTEDDPEAENNKAAWSILSQWQKPFLTLFSDSDPITSGGHVPFEKIVPGAKGQPHEIIKGAGHFLQEDKGEEVARKMINFIKNS